MRAALQSLHHDCMRRDHEWREGQIWAQKVITQKPALFQLHKPQQGWPAHPEVVVPWPRRFLFKDNLPMVALPQILAPDQGMQCPRAPWFGFPEQLMSYSRSKVLTPQRPWLQSQGFAPGVRQDVLALSGPPAPVRSHRKPAVKPGIKLLPERPPGNPSPALITRLHFLCFTHYTRFLLFWYF